MIMLKKVGKTVSTVHGTRKKWKHAENRKCGKTTCSFLVKLEQALHTWVEAKVEVTPLVQPDGGQAGIVAVDHLGGAAGEGVRRRLAEDVAHVRARRDQDLAAAGPHLFCQ